MGLKIRKRIGIPTRTGYGRLEVTPAIATKMQAAL